MRTECAPGGFRARRARPRAAGLRRAGTAAALLAGVLLTPMLSGDVGRAGRLQAQERAGGDGAGSGIVFTNRETRISSFGFRFVDGQRLAPERVRGVIATTKPPALHGVRSALDWVPGISAPPLPRFDPITLQKDVVRLRRLYLRAGFPDVHVDYETRYDAESNRISITMVIDRGEPVRFGAVRLRFVSDAVDAVTDSTGRVVSDSIPDGAALQRPPGWTEELERDLEGLLDRLEGPRGVRFGQQRRAGVEQTTAEWFQNRGYAWARASLVPTDTTERVVDAALMVQSGPRARVDEVVIEGARRLTDRVLRREIPFESGSWYDASAVTGGQEELFELDLVRRALGGVRDGQPRDETVTVRYRLDEGQPRLVWGRVGWRSEAGVAGEAHWSHRDFLGGARTVSVSAAFETGWLSFEPARGRSVGLSVLARQPYLGHRSVAGTIGPFVRYRNDLLDRSLLFGLESAVIFRKRPFSTVTLSHEISRLRVDDAFQLLPISELVASGDSAFAPVFVRSVFTLRGAFGTVRDRVDPRNGFVVEPNISVTGPSGISDIEYVRFGARGVALVPIVPGVGLAVRAAAGRLVPLSESSPSAGTDRTRALAGLRSALFTAGGTADVRGWGRGLVGTRIPDVEVDSDGVVTADRWIPVGGLSRLSGSVELAVPLPFVGEPHRVFTFLDGGRVWSGDERFAPGDPELVHERAFYAAGLGVQATTLVGPLRLSVGYKLNPSRIDLLSAQDVARALAAGAGLDGLEASGLRRWHLHFAIGRGL